MSFRESVQDPKLKLFIHTLTPPNLSESDEELVAKLQHIKQFAGEIELDGINIPEVLNEQRNQRVTRFNPKMDPLRFAQHIAESFSNCPDLILDKVVVNEPWESQRAWFLDAISQFQNVVLVGGESSQISYPGPSVHDGAELIHNLVGNDTHYSLGAISIPTRENEIDRLMRKSRAGVRFFITQVLYEADSIIRVLREYDEFLKRNSLPPTRMFLSFAPLSSENDLEFFRWWDVEVPEQVTAFVFSDSTGVVERSIDQCGQILGEVLNFIRVEKVMIPIGVNIEHVSMRNLANAIKLGKRLFKLVEQHSSK